MGTKSIDYEKLGFRAGIEIHAQLSSRKKLFCNCPAVLTQEKPQAIVKRKFRPVLGEMGIFDPAMLTDFKKDHTIFYEVFNDVCTYELDETPPFPINDEALYSSVKLAKMMNCQIVEETNICRKNYLDGSVPCGFQRTALIGYNGFVTLKDSSMEEEKILPVTWVYIEEDAARKDNDRTKGKRIFYKLDRLGIPLVEIVTHHNLSTPLEVVCAARNLGMLIKSSGIVRRGLGVLRQDINVSITEGARVELKGIQLLQLIPKAIDIEIQRQEGLIAINKELKNRSVQPEDIHLQIHDVTDHFSKTKSKLILSALKRKEHILILPVSGFKGILGREIAPNKRFGTELSDRVKSFTKLKGIIHSDEEMTKYHIFRSEIEGLIEICSDPNSAFVLVIGKKEEGKRALSIVHERIIQAFKGVPLETRRVNMEGISTFMRDLHGKSRLYPDTDSIPIVLNVERVKMIGENLPEHFWKRIKRMTEQYNLSEEIAEELVYNDKADIFETLLMKGASEKVLITTLTQTLIAISREGVNIHNITEAHISEIFEALNAKKFAKEAIPEILVEIGNDPRKTVAEISIKYDGGFNQNDLENLVMRILNESQDLINERGMDAFSPLMGLVMKEARGRIDGKIVSEKLRNLLKDMV